ncbi:YadA-like family protein [Brucella suis bv. 1]|nr:YadA-like family protein [Brucella suis]QOK55890.1 YadA-like family protein [Brucella suis bv. 1]QOK58815.1 YadA-like family protein [Brucella suis bv. 1]
MGGLMLSLAVDAAKAEENVSQVKLPPVFVFELVENQGLANIALIRPRVIAPDNNLRPGGIVSGIAGLLTLGQENRNLISENRQVINNNTTAIGQNSDRIDANAKGVADNRAAIGQNSGRIDANAKGVADNKAAIGRNSGRIDANAKGVADNKTAIGRNSGRIDTNAKGVADNRAAISQNRGRINANAAGVASNRAAIRQNSAAISALGQRVDGLQGQINSARKEARAGAANAAALSGLRYDNRPGKVSIATGVGGFKGSTALAAGIGYTSKNENARYNVSVAYNEAGTSWNAGASFTLN